MICIKTPSCHVMVICHSIKWSKSIASVKILRTVCKLKVKKKVKKGKKKKVKKGKKEKQS